MLLTDVQETMTFTDIQLFYIVRLSETSHFAAV